MSTGEQAVLVTLLVGFVMPVAAVLMRSVIALRETTLLVAEARSDIDKLEKRVDRIEERKDRHG